MQCTCVLKQCNALSIFDNTNKITTLRSYDIYKVSLCFYFSLSLSLFLSFFLSLPPSPPPTVMLQPFDPNSADKNKHKFMVQTMFAPPDFQQEQLDIVVSNHKIFNPLLDILVCNTYNPVQSCCTCPCGSFMAHIPCAHVQGVKQSVFFFRLSVCLSAQKSPDLKI